MGLGAEPRKWPSVSPRSSRTTPKALLQSAALGKPRRWRPARPTLAPAAARPQSSSRCTPRSEWRLCHTSARLARKEGTEAPAAAKTAAARARQITLQLLQSSLERADRLSQRKRGLTEHVQPLRQQAAEYCAQLSAAQKRLLFRQTESADLDAVCPASLPEIRRCASKLVGQCESFCKKLD